MRAGKEGRKEGVGRGYKTRSIDAAFLTRRGGELWGWGKRGGEWGGEGRDEGRDEGSGGSRDLRNEKKSGKKRRKIIGKM